MTELLILMKLERDGKIKIGINRNMANLEWNKHSVVGKIWHGGTLVLVAVVVYVFVKLGIFFGLGAVVLLVLYVRLGQKIATQFVRSYYAKDEGGLRFDAYWQDRMIMIVDISESKPVGFPDDWREKVSQLSNKK